MAVGAKLLERKMAECGELNVVQCSERWGLGVILLGAIRPKVSKDEKSQTNVSDSKVSRTLKTQVL